MSIGNTFENDIMKLLFNATTIANVAENDTSSPATQVHFALHTGDPGEAGAMNSNETSYTSYARVAVDRDTGGLTVTNNSVSPVADIDFPECTGSTAAITHGAVGEGSSGATKLWFSGTVTPNLSISTGVTPRLTTASTITLD